MQDLTPLLQLGGTAVVAIVAIIALSKAIRNSKQNNTRKVIEDLKSNHLATIDAKLEAVLQQGRDNERKNDRIIDLLYQILNKLK